MRHCILVLFIITAGAGLRAQIIKHPSDITVCSGKMAVFSITDTFRSVSKVYQWQVKKTGGGFQDVKNGTEYSGANSDSLTVIKPDLKYNGLFYRCRIDTGSVLADTSLNAKLSLDTLIIQTRTTDTLVCEGQDITFSYQVKGSLLSVKWQVNKGTGWVDITVTGGSPAYSGFNSLSLGLSGVASFNSGYAYRCIVTSPCRNPDTSGLFKLSVNRTPSVTSHPIQDEICVNETAGFSITASGNSLQYQWQVNSGSGWVAVKNSGSVVYTNSQTASLGIQGATPNEDNYIFRCFVMTKACKADTSLSVKLRVYPLPVVQVRDTAVCRNQQVLLTSQVTGGSYPYTYKWSPSGSLQSPFSYQTLTTATTDINYSLEVTDAKQCRQTKTLHLTVLPLPNVWAGNNQVICPGDSAQIGWAPEPGVRYIWNPDTGISNVHLSRTMAGPDRDFNYVITGTDGSGCSRSDTVLVSLKPAPELVLPAVFRVCEKTDTFISVRNDIGYVYSWLSPGGTLLGTGYQYAFRPAPGFQLKVKALNTGTGCSVSTPVNLEVVQAPTLDIGRDTTVCAMNEFKLKATSFSGVSIQWRPSSYFVKNQTSLQPIGMISSTGTHKIWATVSGTFACKSTDSMIIQVLPYTKPEILTSDTLLCRNAYYADYCSNLTGFQQKWTIRQNMGEALTDPTAACLKVHWAGLNTFPATLVLKSWNTSFAGCPGYDSIKVQFKNASAINPVVIKAKSGLTGSGILVCNECNSKEYQWGYEDQFTRKETMACSGNPWCDFQALNTSKYYYFLKAGDGNGCLTKSYYNPPPGAVGIGDLPDGRSEFIRLFPNPASKQTHIVSGSDIRKVHVLDHSGKLLKELEVSGHIRELDLDFDGLATGLYYIRVDMDGVTVRQLLQVIHGS